MAEEGIKNGNEEIETQMNIGDSLEQYMKGYLELRNAIIENCMDCIRDCGRDCLDRDARQLENIRCPLQKARIEHGIAISDHDPFIPRRRRPKREDIH